MSAVWFIFVIGSLNACLGFAIALHLGRRYRASIPPDWDFDDGLSWSDNPEESSSTGVASGQEPAFEEGEETFTAEAVTGDNAGLPNESLEPVPDSELTAASEMAAGEQNDGSFEASAEMSEAPAMPVPTRVDEIVGPTNAPADASMEFADEADREKAAMPGMPVELEPGMKGELEPGSEQAGSQTSHSAALLNGGPRQGVESAGGDTGRKQAEAASELEEDSLRPPAGEISESPMDNAVVSRQTEEPDGEGVQDTTALREATANAAEGAPGPTPSSSATESDLFRSARGEDADAPAAPVEFAAHASHDGDVADSLPRRPASPSSGERAIEALLSEIGQYHEQLGQADVELRAQAEDPDSESIRACLESLLEASREFAEQRERARAGLGDIWSETSEFGVVREQLEGAFERQDSQIESTERAVAAFPYVDDLTQGCRVMIGETTKLIDANLRVRDTLQDVGIELARRENRLGELEPSKLRDGLTGTESREALEGALLQWMQGGDECLDTLSVAAVDIDGFGRLNEEFGHAVGNQLLHAFGKLLIAENRNRARLARYGGERFVLLFPNADLRTTTNAIERLRQIVELACFQYKKSEIRITVSCGVAEAADDDTPESVMARAEATLMEAKRYGRNRTFIHEGKYPTPVVPPKFPIEPRRMTL